MRPRGNPANPFHATHTERLEPAPPARLVLRDDATRSVLVRNTSPDVPFSWSLNPYRGCTHACAYCYARRTHEYLDLGAGEDFERVLLVKREAPALLEAHLRRRSWAGEPIHCAGVTDPYQPVEARLGITRGCLEVLARFRNPVSLITRSPRITRDLDLLTALARHDAVRVQLSLPVADEPTRRALEPGTAPVSARLAALRTLAEAGIPVGVSVAPVIPGLTDHLLPTTLQAAAEAGARWAWMSLLRLPGSVEAVFVERLRAALPGRAEAVLDRLRRMRGDRLTEGRFGARMAGVDPTWKAVEASFRLWCRRLDLHEGTRHFTGPTPFRVPGHGVQLGLFAGAEAPTGQGSAPAPRPRRPPCPRSPGPSC